MRPVADQSGTSIGQITNATAKFSKTVAEAAQNSETAKQKLKAFGIEPKEAINDLDGALGKVFAKIAAAPSDVIQTKLAFDVFGKSGNQFLLFIKQFNGDLPALIAKAKELGIVLGEDDVNAADDFGDQLAELNSISKGVATQFALGFMPQITSALREISGELAGNQSVWRKWGDEIGEILLRFVRGAKVAVAVVKDLTSDPLGFARGDLANTQKALQENLDAYHNDRRRKAREATQNDPNRPDFLKQQDKDIKRIGRQSEIDDSDIILRPLSSSKKKEITDSFDKQFREIADEFGFTVSRTFGKAVNKGSLHPSGNAGDLSVAGKTNEQAFNVIAAFLEKGLRVIDERVVGAFKGIKSTGPNIHAEQGAGVKPSLFLDASYYGSEKNLAYLKKLDEDRRNKKTSVDDAEELAKKKVEDDKKANEELVKQNDEASKRVLDRAKQTADEEQAINEQLLAKKQISQDEFDKRNEQADIELLNKEKILLEDHLEFAK